VTTVPGAVGVQGVAGAHVTGGYVAVSGSARVLQRPSGAVAPWVSGARRVVLVRASVLGAAAAVRGLRLVRRGAERGRALLAGASRPGRLRPALPRSKRTQGASVGPLDRPALTGGVGREACR
jgi:hypothetical protein